MSPAQDDENIHKTYFGLRIGMFALASLLFAAIGVQWLEYRCWQGSISAYYYTPAGPVFVASLCAIGACLVVYKGNTTFENGTLNVAGFLAAVIAFVPTDFYVDREGCVPMRLSEAVSEEVLAAMIASENQAAVQNGVSALLVAGLIAVVGNWVNSNYGEAVRSGRIRRSREARGALLWSSSIVAALLLILGLSFTFARGAFEVYAHKAAAVLFFLCILVVIAHNALEARRAQGPKDRKPVGPSIRYWTIFGATVALIAIIAVARWVRPDFRMAVFWLEAVGIAGFTLFWLFQTIELGGDVRRWHTAEDDRPSSDRPASTPPQGVLS